MWREELKIKDATTALVPFPIVIVCRAQPEGKCAMPVENKDILQNVAAPNGHRETSEVDMRYAIFTPVEMVA